MGIISQRDTSPVVKVTVTIDGDSAYAATGRVHEVTSEPGPFVTRVGPLSRNSTRELVFAVDGKSPDRSAAAFRCKKGQEITWSLVEIVKLRQLGQQP